MAELDRDDLALAIGNLVLENLALHKQLREQTAVASKNGKPDPANVPTPAAAKLES